MESLQSFETKRLILQPTLEGDAPFLFELFNTPKWIKYIGDRNIKSVADSKRFIQTKIIPQSDRLGFSTYTIMRKADGAKVGTVGLYDRKGLNGIDLGFALLPQFERKGYGFESANKLKTVASEFFKLEKLKAITAKDNFASQKLLKKIGFKQVITTFLTAEKGETLFVYEAIL